MFSLGGFNKEEYNSLNYINFSYEKLVKEMSTPEEVSDYLTNCLRYQFSDPYFIRSPKRVHKDLMADCIEASITAAALLENDGYNLNYLWMFNDDYPNGHAVYFYQDSKSKLFGTIGIFKDDNHLPAFSNLEEIANFFCFEYYMPLRVDQFMIKDDFGVLR